MFILVFIFLLLLAVLSWAFLYADPFNCVLPVSCFFLRLFIHALRIAKGAQSDYIWKYRTRLPFPLRELFDRVLCVDSSAATLGVSSGYASIRIDQAVATYDGVDYDVKDMMEMIWLCGNGDRIRFNLHRVLAFEDMVVDKEATISLRVKYCGHGNVDKRYFPQTYSARYTGTSYETSMFPPYPSSDTIKKGLGTVKIIDATNGDGKSFVTEARESGGLRGKFYVDLKDDGTLVRNVMNFLEESERIHEDLEIKVVTNKGQLVIN